MIALRPLSLGDIFNGAFGYLRDNPKATLGVTFIVTAIASILPALGLADFSREYAVMFDAILEDPAAEPEMPFSAFTLVGTYGGALIQLLATGLLVGLLSGVVGRAVLGQRLSFGEAVRAVRGRLGAIFGLTGIYLLVTLVAIALFGVLFGVSVALLGGVGLLLALAVGIPLGVLLLWASIKTTLAMPVIVLERIGPFQALVRSWRLTSGSFWRLVGILLLTQLLVQLVASILATPFTVGGLLVGVLVPDPVAATVVSAALGFVGLLLTGCISSPFTAGVTALLYLDLRMRREGLDLKLQSAVHSGQALGPDVYLTEQRPGVPA